MPPITILGEQTKTIFLKGIENHKLHQEFEVGAGQTIKKGQPVILDTDGTVKPAAATEKTNNIIGWSIHDGAAEEFITVGMRAMAIVWASPNGAVDAGPVAYNGMNITDGMYNAFKAIGDDDDALAGWQLDKATAKDEMVRVAVI